MSHRLLPAIAIVAFAGAAHAEDPEVAKHFALGNDLYAEGRYADALVEYDAAYALSHNFKILYNRGQCLVLLKREPDAIRTFERYLADGGDQIDPERRASVEADLVKLRQRLGKLHLTGIPAGASVSLDGRKIGDGPFDAPFDVGAGEHTVEVDPHEGRAVVRTEVSVVAGTTVSAVVDVPPKPASEVRAFPPVPPPLPDRGFYSGLGIAYLVAGNVLQGCAQRLCSASSDVAAPWLTARLGYQTTPWFAAELALGALGALHSSITHRGDGEATYGTSTNYNGVTTRALLDVSDEAEFSSAPTLSLHAVFTPIHETFRLSVAAGAGVARTRLRVVRLAGGYSLQDFSGSTAEYPFDHGWTVLPFVVPEVRASFALRFGFELGLSAGAFIGLPATVPSNAAYGTTPYGRDVTYVTINTPDVRVGPFVTFEGSLFLAKRFGR